MRLFVVASLLLLAAGLLAERGNAGPGAREEPHEGYRLLTEKSYLRPDFHQSDFDAVWQVWPEPLRSRAEQATVAERRRMAFRRYGLTPRPDAPGKPLQYVVDDDGNWTLNCFACHGGLVDGETVPGRPNARLALQTLAEEMRASKMRRGRPLSRMELGSVVVPLGSVNGTTNSVIFGIALMSSRDGDLNVRPSPRTHKLDHHDLDAPPWWHFKKRRTLYADGFIEKDHRPLMTFMLIPRNGPEKFHAWDEDFAKVGDYLESLEAPKWPWEVDEELAARGRRVFEKTCARCHGTYGEDPTVRLRALTKDQRAEYGRSWLGRYGALEIIPDPIGYVAPPLDGIWASAPYFHNGSVPTLWHVLRPDARPRIWRRKEARDGDVYDRERVGPAVETYEDLPPEARESRKRREFYDTRRRGLGNGGHDYPADLTGEQKRALLEYLKTL